MTRRGTGRPASLTGSRHFISGRVGWPTCSCRSFPPAMRAQGSGTAVTAPKTHDRPGALIIGGSMGGLFTALLLRRAGWDVAVYERNGTDLAGRGAGIVTHPELF